MPLHEVCSLEDRRLDPYREIRTRQSTERDGWFIAEGPILVEELLASDFECPSVLIQRKFLDRFRSLSQTDVDLLCVPDAMVQELVGFKFHRGIMACGLRRPVPSVNDLIHGKDASDSNWELSSSDTLVGLMGIHDPENLGSILRNCAGLGIRHVLLGPSNTDPFSRRALKVSMGTTFRIQLWSSSDFVSDLAALKQLQGVTCLATSVGRDTTPLEQVRRSGPTLVLLGNEANGLPSPILSAADHRVTIPMAPGVDSLNVAVAAGIVLHYLARLADR